MQKDGGVLELIDSVYAAVDQPALWDDFLRKLATVCDGSGAVVFVAGVPPKAGDFIRAWGLDDSLHNAYSQIFDQRHHWMNNGGARHGLPLDVPVASDMLVAQSAKPAATWGAVAESHHGAAMRGIGAAVWSEDGNALSMVKTLRSGKLGAPDERTRAVYEALVPHLRNALNLRRRLAELESRRDFETAILDRVPLAVLSMDEFGRMTAINARARKVLERRDGLVIEGDGTCVPAAAEDAKVFRRLVEQVRTGAVSVGVMPVRRPSQARPYSLRIEMAPNDRPEIGSGSRVMVLIGDHDDTPAAPPQLLSELFRLTPTEAKLVDVMVRGLSVKEAAGDLGIAEGTARFHLKQVFRKTETGRQAELMRLVLTGPLALDAKETS